ncbi:MAG: amidohydrolase [Actinomycetales bacterium]
MGTPDPEASAVTRLLINGAVYSASDPFATAMLVVGDTVAWVGSDGAAETHRDSADEVVDLDGRLVAPAFVDAHVHCTETGLALTTLDLGGAASVADVLDRVAAYSRAHPGETVLGAGWDELTWPEQRPPTRTELDRAADGAPVYLARVDVHSAVVSTAMADLGGPALTSAPGWDDSGRVEREAHHVVRAATRRALTPQRRRHLQEVALRAAAAAGIGVVHEIAAPHIVADDDTAVLRELLGGVPLPEVVTYWGEAVETSDQARDLARARGVAGLAGDLVVDGSIGSRTAALLDPYTDAAAAGLDPGYRGHRYLDDEQVRLHLRACTAVGLQAGFHVIGDDAIRAVVAGLRAVEEELGTAAIRACRHRLEHLELLDTADIADLARWGVVASVQPVFDELWGGPESLYATRLGGCRAAAMNPFASLQREGVAVALGSDSPVTPLQPWRAVRAAAWHQNADQRLTVRAAFAAHTRGGWRAARADQGGVLAPGAPATYAVWRAQELVVQTPDERVAAWSTDPRAGVPALPLLGPDIPLPVCEQTVVRGRVVYEAA